jgi:thiol-disulfide isomerase/thioredoxin
MTWTHIQRLLVIAVLGSAFALTACPNRKTVRAPGDTMPTATVDGTQIEFDERLSPDGETLVLFMTKWCEVCRAEQADVEAWARSNADVKTVVVIMQADAKSGRDLVSERKLDTDVLDVIVDPDGSVAKRFGVTATPTLIQFAGKAPAQRYYRIAQVSRNTVPAGATAEPIVDPDSDRQTIEQ